MRLTKYLASWLVTAALAGGALAEDADVTVLAEYPSGTFLENLDHAHDGGFVITSYFARTLKWLNASGTELNETALDVHPVAIKRFEDGYVMTAHGLPFTDPDFGRDQRVLFLAANGDVVSRTVAPDARFLNGIAVTGDEVLIADSIAGTIWSATRETVTAWLTDPLLTPDFDAAVFLPGANGIARVEDQVLVSNSSRGTLLSVQDDAVTIVAETGPIDDFAVLDGGVVAFASHNEKVGRIGPNGQVSTLLAEGCDGCTSVLLDKTSPDARLIVLTTGNMLEGGQDPARVLSIPLK